MTHTKGPWKARFGECIDILGPGNEGRVAHLTHLRGAHGVLGRRLPSEVSANARLIAAAPDLLDALEDMLSGWRYIREKHGDLYGVGWDRAQEKAVTAIAKAKGE